MSVLTLLHARFRGTYSRFVSYYVDDDAIDDVDWMPMVAQGMLTLRRLSRLLTRFTGTSRARDSTSEARLTEMRLECVGDGRYSLPASRRRADFGARTQMDARRKVVRSKLLVLLFVRCTCGFLFLGRESRSSRLALATRLAHIGHT